jgi:hypothetical protein
MFLRNLKDLLSGKKLAPELLRRSMTERLPPKSFIRPNIFSTHSPCDNVEKLYGTSQNAVIFFGAAFLLLVPPAH